MTTLKPSIEPLKAVKVGIMAKGDGINKPKRGDQLHVTYIGRFHGGERHGQVFDHTKEKAFTFRLGMKQVIRGWDAGFKHISLGTKAMLQIPWQYAYGETGIVDSEATRKAQIANKRNKKSKKNKKNKAQTVYSIPPKQDLAFEVQLLGINNLKWDATNTTTQTQTQTTSKTDTTNTNDAKKQETEANKNEKKPTSNEKNNESTNKDSKQNETNLTQMNKNGANKETQNENENIPKTDENARDKEKDAAATETPQE